MHTQFIVFRVGREEFGVAIDKVREIIKSSAITAIPNSPRFIKGIINVRGEIVTTIDIKSYLELDDKHTEPKHIIVTKQSDCLFGLIVDEVIEIIRAKKENVQQPTLLAEHQHEKYINGIIMHENRLIVLLDLMKIISWNKLTSYNHSNYSYDKGLHDTTIESLL